MQIPDYRLVGSPRRNINGRGQQAKNYSQQFRILREKNRRAVSLKTNDKGIATRRAVEFVEAKVKQLHLKTNPVARTAHSSVTKVLDEYVADLLARGNTLKQSQQVKTRIERVLTEAKITEYAQIDSVIVTKAISSLWQQDIFKTAVTANRYREASRAWSRWMKRNDRWPTNVLEELERFKGDSTPSRLRDRLTDEQLETLIRVTSTGPMRRNLFGEERAWLYAIASQTGLRASELHSLSPASFHLESDPPCVEIHCTVSKRRTTDRIELQVEFANMLRVWLSDKTHGKLLWGRSTGWFKKAATMLRLDLESADLPTTVETESGTAVIDFHSFRAYRVSQVLMTGTPIAVAMKTVRLSSEALLQRYTKIHQTESSVCVNSVRLPKLDCLKMSTPKS